MLQQDHERRVEALEAVWRCWAELGEELDAEGWASPSRCDGWDVAALYVHVGAFPHAVEHVPPTPVDAPVGAVTAEEILRGFNVEGGVAHAMAATVAASAAGVAARSTPEELAAPFRAGATRAVAVLRARDRHERVPWPAVAVPTTVGEAIRIVLLESVVHLLDVHHAVGRPPQVPADALRETALLLVEIADTTTFIEAATGRSASSPLPVLR